MIKAMSTMKTKYFGVDILINGDDLDLTARYHKYRYAGRMILYYLNKCELKINGTEKSNTTVGDNGNIDSLLNKLAYSIEEELEYA